MCFVHISRVPTLSLYFHGQSDHIYEMQNTAIREDSICNPTENEWMMIIVIPTLLTDKKKKNKNALQIIANSTEHKSTPHTHTLKRKIT